jgi:hypothetical protein
MPPVLLTQSLTLCRAIFLANVVLSIWSMIPTQEQKEARQKRLEEEIDDFTPVSAVPNEKTWEMSNMSGGAVPFTPRTTAFNKLGGVR